MDDEELMFSGEILCRPLRKQVPATDEVSEAVDKLVRARMAKVSLPANLIVGGSQS